MPQGYVVEDNEPLSSEAQAIFDMVPEFTLPNFLLSVCPEELAKPAIGGGHTCENPPEVTFGLREGSGVIGSADAVHVMKYTNLLERAEFGPVVRQGKNITVDEFYTTGELVIIAQPVEELLEGNSQTNVREPLKPLEGGLVL